MTMSNLQKVLNSGAFVVTGELGPPKSAEREKIEHHGHLLGGVVDAVNLTDNQTAIVRTSSIACGKILVDMDIDPVIQITCRDRNRIAIQSDVLGAVALGIKNILCLQGDHANFGNEPAAKNVNDLDSMNLIRSLKNMRDEQVFIGGEKLEAPIDIFIGAVENPFADPFEYRAYRLAKKVEAGVDFIQTQAIFDMDRFERWMAKVRELGIHKKVPILAGVIPIKSLGAARYMKNNVSGMIVPDEIIDRIKAAENKKEEGVKLCVEMIKHLKTIEGVAGVHLMAVAWEEIVPEIVERAGLLPRPKFD
ncbi:MAG: methylenetetrahydrofolate reductase [Clostridiales bacterium]|nr:methylenetetrahydrofolate reductase [Clostridiales bacterium]